MIIGMRTVDSSLFGLLAKSSLLKKVNKNEWTVYLPKILLTKVNKGERTG